jgi:aminoglycoside 6'-N-acetyltransferase I
VAEASIRAARPEDAGSLLPLRCALYSDGPEEEHRRELAAFFDGEAREPLEILVAEGSAGILLGFCELSIRPYADGCRTDRVGYLEGWYVVPDARRRGLGAALVAAAEEWARGRGCSEFASDAVVDNRVSIAAHRALGFEDAGVIRCFRKDL